MPIIKISSSSFPSDNHFRDRQSVDEFVMSIGYISAQDHDFSARTLSGSVLFYRTDFPRQTRVSISLGSNWKTTKSRMKTRSSSLSTIARLMNTNASEIPTWLHTWSPQVSFTEKRRWFRVTEFSDLRKVYFVDSPKNFWNPMQPILWELEDPTPQHLYYCTSNA